MKTRGYAPTLGGVHKLKRKLPEGQRPSAQAAQPH